MSSPTTRSALSVRIPGFDDGVVLSAGLRTTVLRTVRRADGRPVVLKMLTHATPAPEDFGRYRCVWRLTAGLIRPGVVRVLDLIEHEGRPVLVMEDAGGVSLDQILPPRGLEPDRALRIAVALAGALRDLHQAGLIHRDLNPSNAVLVPSTGAVQLIDLDMASPIVQGGDASEIGGTLAWMAPEQTGRTGHPVDARADLYGLGTTLYALLTGGPPFRDADPLALIYGHLAVAPRPAHLLRPDLPRAVSDVVARLLAKAPEDRYQSAAGVAADLARCSAELEATGDVAPFALGAQDRDGALVLAHKLYGREAESARLLQRFESASTGKAELFLISGVSGIGKTRIVQEVQRSITRRRGRFAEGKYNQYQNTPASALSAALRQLLRDALAEPEARAEALRGRLREAIGANGGILVDVLPELPLLLGPQGDAPPLPPAEAQNRFNRTFRRFVLAFAQADQPLVLFLDDLQWADPSSLLLMRQLLLDPDASALLLIGAYRDNEVGPGHPLLRTLDELREGGAPVDAVQLGPLSGDAVAQLVADSLRDPVEQVAPLAELVNARSHGNPFFVEHLLRLLVERQALVFRADEGRWRWDLSAATALGVSEDVGALLAGTVRRLPQETATALQQAAVLGARFDLGTLSVVAERPAGALLERLWPAVEAGLLLVVGEGWRFIGSVPDSEARLAFAHDRVQEAAYQLVPEGERPDLHLAVGRLLLGSPARDEQLLDIVVHMNRGLSRITDPGERRALAELNHEAGRRARQRGAYDAAWSLFEVGTGLLTQAGDEAARALAYWLHHDRAEAASLSGRYDDARAEANVATALARDAAERTNVTVIRLGVHSVLGEFAPAVATAIAALQEFGLEPAQDAAGWQGLAMGLMGQIGAATAESGVAALADAPPLTDEAALSELRVLAACAGAAMPDPPFFAWVASRMTWLSVAHGAAIYSPVGYVFYGFLLTAFGQPAAGDAFGQAALALSERLDVAPIKPPVHHIYGVYVAPRLHPLDTCWRHCRAAYDLGLEHGVFPSAGWAVANLPWLELWKGDELGAVADGALQLLKVAQHLLKNADSTHMIASAAHTVFRLTGRLEDAAALTAQGLGEREALDRLAHYDMALAPSWTLRLMAAVTLQDRALMAEALEVGPRLNAIDLLYSALDFPFWAALAHLDLGRLEAPEGLEAWSGWSARVAAAAAGSPTSFRSKALLLDALDLQRQGDVSAAAERMDEAIAAAQADGQIGVEVQALERAAALATSRPRLARLYREDARLACVRWGALARVTALEALYPELAPPVQVRDRTRSQSDLGAVDVETVSRASQALASEIRLDQLLTRLMSIVVENAGASRGCLLREQGGAWAVAAWAEDGQIGTGPNPSASHSPQIVAYVARTGETVLLDDADADPRYRATPYVEERRPRSVLALPLVHQGRTTALLYLENNLAPGAFSGARVALLRLLSGLAATALVNATLYSATQAAAEELTHKNAQLTELDRMREEFLARTSHELRTPLHGIIGLAQSLADGATGALPPDTRHNLAMIVSSGRRLSSLVNDILDLSTLRRRGIVLRQRPLSLAPVIDGVLAVCRPLLGERPLSLRSEIAADLPLAQADRDRVEQVLLNLVSNAMKFTDRGEVVVRAERGGDQVVVTVIDTGIGVAPEDLARIFDAFDQGEHDPGRGGTGLGLAISSQLVALHGGELTATSEPGVGSRFRFTLPMAEGDAIAAEVSLRPTRPSAPVTPTLASAGDGPGPLVLVVDDEPVNLQVLLLQLKQRGFRPVTALSGAAALELIERGPLPDLVLLDVMMPVMSGFEVAARLRARFLPTELPIIMLTAKSQPSDVVEGMGSGANDYVAKPFSTDELLARVRTHLNLAHMHRAAERFVPHAFLELLNRASVFEVQKGDSAAREMTVLSADLRGFTRILEQRPALETFRFLNDYLGTIEPWIVSNHGFVDRYVGAALTALFPGGPHDALTAAVALVRAAQAFNEARMATGEAPITMGIGLNAGHLLLGTVGGERHLDTTVVSEAVGVAERVNALCSRYNASIIVTGSVLDGAPEALRGASRLLDRLTLEGRPEPIAIYEVYDADPPALRAAKDATRPSFESAVRLFHDRAFGEAQRLFALCQALNPLDQAVLQYQERAARIQRSLMMMEP